MCKFSITIYSITRQGNIILKLKIMANYQLNKLQISIN